MINNGEVNERTYRGAAVIELIHTATLVHDDVVDESYNAAVSSRLMPYWKNKIAGFGGVIIYCPKVCFCRLIMEILICLKIISLAVREMSEGELLQIEKARRLDITEEVYYEIIRQKTATLIAACCS